MKHGILFLVFSIAPMLLFSQPLKEHVSKPDYASGSQTIDLSKKDIIQPVLSRNIPDDFNDNSLQRQFTKNTGLAFLSSAILPGSGQMINNNWIRGGIYAALEITTAYLIIDFNNQGEKGQRRYENFADENWSVAQYAQWLVEYHDYNSIDNPHIEDLRNMVEGLDPAFDTSIDWQNINLDILRNVERNTPFIRSDAQLNDGTTFSHILPAYGSQQYYELISKYFQFQAGWRDYDTSQYFIEPGGGNASSYFYRGATLAEQFNDDFRVSKNLKLLLVANHVISAFDSFFTFQLKQNRLKATTSTAPSSYIKLNYYF